MPPRPPALAHPPPTQVIKPASKTLLEEPRAELTALHTLRLLLRGGHLARPQVECLLCCFMLSDLRRFAAWDSSATRPYTGWRSWGGSWFLVAEHASARCTVMLWPGCLACTSTPACHLSATPAPRCSERHELLGARRGAWLRDPDHRRPHRHARQQGGSGAVCATALHGCPGLHGCAVRPSAIYWSPAAQSLSCQVKFSVGPGGCRCLRFWMRAPGSLSRSWQQKMPWMAPRWRPSLPRCACLRANLISPGVQPGTVRETRAFGLHFNVPCALLAVGGL